MQTDLQFRIAGDCCCPPAVGSLNVLPAAIYASYANSFIGHQFDVMGIGIYMCMCIYHQTCLSVWTYCIYIVSKSLSRVTKVA